MATADLTWLIIRNNSSSLLKRNKLSMSLVRQLSRIQSCLGGTWIMRHSKQWRDQCAPIKWFVIHAQLSGLWLCTEAHAFISNYHNSLLALFLFGIPASVYFLLFSLICFRIKFSKYLSRQCLLPYINQIYLILNAPSLWLRAKEILTITMLTAKRSEK